jgi:hypothetical protein
MGLMVRLRLDVPSILTSAYEILVLVLRWLLFFLERY